MKNLPNAVKDFLFRERNGWVRVEGDSMSPNLVDGQRIRVIPVAGPLVCGKCYVFVHNDALCVHRLLRTSNGVATFIGDYTSSIQTVPERSVVAEAVLDQGQTAGFLITCINRLYHALCPPLPYGTRTRRWVVAMLDSLRA